MEVLYKFNKIANYNPPISLGEDYKSTFFNFGKSI